MVDREVSGQAIVSEEDLFSVLVPRRVMGLGIERGSGDVVTFLLDDGSRVRFESRGWDGGESEILMSWFVK